MERTVNDIPIILLSCITVGTHYLEIAFYMQIGSNLYFVLQMCTLIIIDETGRFMACENSAYLICLHLLISDIACKTAKRCFKFALSRLFHMFSRVALILAVGM